jgi:GTP-binding protein
MMHHVFDHYGPAKKGAIAARQNGVMLANMAGKTTGFSLFNLQERGRLLLAPQVAVYEGMIIGIHSRDNDLVVNPTKGKPLTNIRASGTDESIMLTPPVQFSLEQALEFIEGDELVEVTPHELRLRKKFLKEHERKKAERGN